MRDRYLLSLWLGSTCLWLHRHPTVPPRWNCLTESVVVFVSVFVSVFDVCTTKKEVIDSRIREREGCNSTLSFSTGFRVN